MEREELIRPEALRRKYLSAESRPLAGGKNLLRNAVLVLVAITVSAALLLTFTSYKVTEQAPGVLVPLEGLQKLSIGGSGRLGALLVEEGDPVRPGQALARVSLASVSQFSETHDLRIEAVRKRRDSLLEKLPLHEREHALAMRRNSELLAHADQSLLTARRKQALLRERIRVSERHLRQIESLFEAAAITTFQFDEAYAAHLQLEQEAAESERQEAEQEIRLKGLQADLRQQELAKDQLDLALREEIDQLSSEILQLQTQRSVDLRAERAGLVATIAVRAGDSFRAGQPLIYLGPEQSILAAELYVPSRVIGKLAVGQQVLLSYESFDYREYGRYAATIESVAGARLDPREQLLPLSLLNEPVYRVRAALERQSVEGPEEHVLLAGMQFQAHVVTDELPLIGLVFKPLRSLRGLVW
ncbi:MAG: HlyD family efflux transporter periplasmic adaptor subunit [Gammaproteobacteria bacterium]|nr:HlyD family efflux transporter periplasmic adaptor subunit [Gammaproteobacteria bacterium]